MPSLSCCRWTRASGSESKTEVAVDVARSVNATSATNAVKRRHYPIDSLFPSTPPTAP